MAQITSNLIALAKKQKEITTNSYDDLIEFHLKAGLQDLGFAGVEVPEQLDETVESAVMLYFLIHFNFGEPPASNEMLEKSYNEKKGQLSHATGYTDWLVT